MRTRGRPRMGNCCPAAPELREPPTVRRRRGEPSAVTPEFKGNVTGRYRFSVGDYKSFAQASLLHQSSATSTIDSATESILGPTPAFTTVDFSAGTGAGNWNLVLYIENAFDKRGQLNRFGQCGATLCYEEPRIYPIKPQNFGVKFGQKF